MHEIVKKTIEFYESAYKSFSVSRNKHPWPVLVKWAKEVKENDALLDMGCGNGRLYPLLGKHKSYLAVDPVEGFLKEVGDKFKVETFQAALPDIPEHIKEFDRIFCIAVLQHLPKSLHQESVKALHQALKTDGVIYLTCWNILYHRVRFNPWKRNYWISYKADGDKKFRYIYRFTPRYLKKLFQKNGFHVKYCHYGEVGEVQPRHQAANVILKARKINKNMV